MTIERATDDNDFFDLSLDDDARFVGLSFYEVLHHLIHQTGTEAWAAATQGAKEAGLKELKEGETVNDIMIMVPSPNLKVPLPFFEQALARFNETHDAQELKEAAKPAQSYFGGSLAAVLSTLSGMSVTVEPGGDDEADPKAKLH